MGAVGGAAAPVTIHGSTWGAIGFGGADATRLVPATGSRLSRFADLIAATIASAEAWRALAVQASTDALTGLANHRTFHEHLDAAILDTTREPAAVALVLLDVDHFKRVNDTHGHRAGDDVLATVARLLAAQARPGDVVARVGGEEFAWLMMGVDEATATSRAEAARAAIAAAIIPTVGSVTVSASVGAQVKAARAADVYALADRALYAAKQRGRNTVVAATTQIRHDDATTSRGYEAVRALARAVDVLDDDTRQHSERVADLAVRIAAALGWSAQRILLLRDAALLHDIGKIGIPRQIIRKPGRLDADETQEMRRHAALGARIAEDALSAEQVAWIRGHHERPDGEGYPDGLARNAVTEGARVIALADAFDVMTAVGTYQPRRTVTEALAECERLAGRQFDPEMVGILRGLVAPFPDRDETN